MEYLCCQCRAVPLKLIQCFFLSKLKISVNSNSNDITVYWVSYLGKMPLQKKECLLSVQMEYVSVCMGHRNFCSDLN